MTTDRGAVGMVVFANAFALAIAWWEQWSMFLLLLPYWVQSVVIGWYSGKRILALERFTTEEDSNFSGGSDEEIKRNTVKFFAISYGICHFVYLLSMFLIMQTGKMPGNLPSPEITATDAAWIAVVSGVFVLTHRASFKRNIEYDRKGCPNIVTLFFLPYARVLPMHITFVIGLSLGYSGAVLLFGALKTAADVLMHCVEHQVLARPVKSAP